MKKECGRNATTLLLILERQVRAWRRFFFHELGQTIFFNTARLGGGGQGRPKKKSFQFSPLAAGCLPGSIAIIMIYSSPDTLDG